MRGFLNHPQPTPKTRRGKEEAVIRAQTHTGALVIKDAFRLHLLNNPFLPPTRGCRFNEQPLFTTPLHKCIQKRRLIRRPAVPPSPCKKRPCRPSPRRQLVSDCGTRYGFGRPRRRRVLRGTRRNGLGSRPPWAGRGRYFILTDRHAVFIH